MAQFIARIELYGAQSDDYAKLHTTMEMAGFVRTVTLQDGPEVMLPTAEYLLIDSLTTEQVLDVARKATSTVWQSFGAVVAKVDGTLWVSGLKPSQKRTYA